MKITEVVSYLRFRWLGGTETLIQQREQFIADVIRTNAFSKLTLQDKLLSVGRMTELFRVDNGYTPKCLDEALELLNRKLTLQIVKNWSTQYSNLGKNENSTKN